MRLALAVGTALSAGGCMSTATPGPFPSVFTDPPRHEDAPLAPDEVKQALDSLVSDRNHLCAQTSDPAAGNPQQCGQTSGAAAKPR